MNNKFSTEIGLLYKYARELEYPVDTIFYLKSNDVYLSVYNYINSYLTNYLEKDKISLGNYPFPRKLIVDIYAELYNIININPDYFIYWLYVAFEDIEDIEDIDKLLSINYMTDVYSYIDYQSEVLDVNNANDVNLFISKYDNLNNNNTELSIEIANRIEELEWLLTDNYNLNFTDYTETNLNKLDYVFDIKLDKDVDGNGFDIFNRSCTSEDIPFISYYLNEDSEYIKLYKGENIDVDIDYSHIMDTSIKRKHKNTIVFVIKIGKQEINKSNNRNFFVVTYDISYNTISFSVNFENKESVFKEIIRKIKVSFPFISLLENKISNLKGSFSIAPIKEFNYWDDFVFLHLTYNNEMFYNYIYMGENTTPYSLKNNYKNLQFNFKPEYMERDLSKYLIKSRDLTPQFSKFNIRAVKQSEPFFNINTENNGTIELAKGSVYFTINFSGIVDEETIDIFKNYIVSYINSYIDSYDKILDRLDGNIYSFYEKLIPDITKYEDLLQSDSTFSGRKSSRKGVTVESKMKKLKKSNFTELFTKSGFSSKCKVDRQPIIENTEEEIDKIIKNSNKELLKMPYPEPSKETLFWYTCDNDKYPYPGLNRNVGSLREEFPLFPCCFTKDKLKKYKGGRQARIASYYDDMLKEKSKKTDYTVKSYVKILNYKQKGELDKVFLKILDYPYPNLYNFNRLGVFDYANYGNVNSLIHCCLVGIRDENYHKSDNKEKYAEKIKKMAIETINPNILKQELYDLKSEKEIIDYYNNNFLDPRIFYRIFEEFFNINIYVFKTDKISNGNYVPKLEIPRYLNFHIRYPNLDRLTFIIYKSEHPKTKEENCELVFSQGKEGIYLNYDNKYTSILYKVLELTSQSLTFSDERGYVYRNMYNNLDIFLQYKESVTGQRIDGLGKCRMINILHQDATDKSGQISIFTPPLQPFSAPLSQEIYRTKILSVLKIFGDPSSYYGNNTYIYGLWFPVLNVKNMYYIPTVPIRIKDVQLGNVKLGPQPPYKEHGKLYNLDKIRQLRKTLSIILQITIYAFDIYRINYRNKHNQGLNKDTIEMVEYFFNKYVKIHKGEYVKDQIGFYNVKNLNYKIKEHNNVEKFIKYINKFTPLSDGNYLIMYSKDFYRKIKWQLSLYLKNTFDIEEIVKKEYLDNYYVSEKDFRINRNEKLFFSRQKMINWIDKLHNKNVDILRTKLDNNIKHEFRPIFYRNESGNIFIIQNNIFGRLDNIIETLSTWENKNYNLGKNVNTTISKQKRPFILYSISSDGELKIVKSYTNSNHFYNIIEYSKGTTLDSGTYGAMLEL